MYVALAGAPSHCAWTTSVERSVKMEAPLIVESTASFDEAIVIDSDDSDDDFQSEPPHPLSPIYETLQSDNETLQQSEDGQSPTKRMDNTDEPLNISIKVSLPLPRRLATRDCPSPMKLRQRNDSDKSCRSKLSLASKRRKTVTDQETSVCESRTVQSLRVSDEAEEIELDMSVESVLHCSSGDDQRTNSSASNADGSITEPLVQEPLFMFDPTPQEVAVCPGETDVNLLTRSTSVESPDLFPEKAENDAEVTSNVEMPSAENDQPPEQSVESVPEAPVMEEDGEDRQRSTTLIEEGAGVEQNESRLSEKTLTEADTPALDESHVSETAGADVEISAPESCSLPPVLDDATPPTTTDAELNPPQHAEARLPVSAAPSDTDPSTADLSHTKVCHKTVRQKKLRKSRSPGVRKRSALKNKPDGLSSLRDSKAVKKKAKTFRKTTLSRQTYKRPVTASTSKKFRTSAKFRKRCTALSERLQPQTGQISLPLSVDDVSSANIVSGEKNLTSTEDNVLPQKYTETVDVLPSIEKDTTVTADTAAAAESYPDQCPERVASPRCDVATLLDQSAAVFKPSELPVAEDVQESSQVVTGQLAASPAHTDDGEVAQFSMSSAECVFSPPDPVVPDWVKARCSDHEPLTYSHVELRNRLQGISDVYTCCFVVWVCNK